MIYARGQYRVWIGEDGLWHYAVQVFTDEAMTSAGGDPDNRSAGPGFTARAAAVDAAKAVIDRIVSQARMEWIDYTPEPESDD